MKLTQTWNHDANGGEKLFHQVHEHQYTSVITACAISEQIQIEILYSYIIRRSIFARVVTQI
jgi:hypothetical protein